MGLIDVAYGRNARSFLGSLRRGAYIEVRLPSPAPGYHRRMGSAAFEFVLNGAVVRVEGTSANTSLLSWLRSTGRTGSKEGSATVHAPQSPSAHPSFTPLCDPIPRRNSSTVVVGRHGLALSIVTSAPSSMNEKKGCMMFFVRVELFR